MFHYKYLMSTFIGFPNILKTNERHTGSFKKPKKNCFFK